MPSVTPSTAQSQQLTHLTLVELCQQPEYMYIIQNPKEVPLLLSTCGTKRVALNILQFRGGGGNMFSNII